MKLGVVLAYAGVFLILGIENHLFLPPTPFGVPQYSSLSMSKRLISDCVGSCPDAPLGNGLTGQQLTYFSYRRGQQWLGIS